MTLPIESVYTTLSVADFCKQCSIRIFGEDHRELAGLSTPEDTENGMFAQAICEGCGATLVDHEGACRFNDCIHKHGRTGLPTELADLTVDDFKFIVFCLGFVYGKASEFDEKKKNFVHTSHDRVVPKINAVFKRMGEEIPNALVATDGAHAAEAATMVLVGAPLIEKDDKELDVDSLLFALSQPVVDGICFHVQRNELDQAKQLVVEHASVSPEIAQQFVDWAVREWQKKSSSQPT